MNVRSFLTMPSRTIRERSLTKFDDVVGELLPLECLIVVDIDLTEQLDELLDQLGLVGVLGPKMVEHDLEELFETQAIILALVEILLDLLQLAVVEVTHDVLILLVPVLVRVILPVYWCQ